MGAVGWLIAHRLRARALGLVPLLVVVVLGVTGTLVAAGAASRTADAYPDYLDRARVGDVVINPSLFDTQIDRVIRDLPGVRSVRTDALFAVTADEGEPRTNAQVSDDGSGIVAEIRGSVDGRYTEGDRPAVVEGRLPTGRNEAFVNRQVLDTFGLGVGDELPLAFWSRRDDIEGDAGRLSVAGEGDERIVHPIGVEHLRVVGVGNLPDEVLPDELYERNRILVSPDIVDRYDCLPEPVTPDMTDAEIIATQGPEGCATSYQYWSLEIEGGEAGVRRALEVFNQEAEELTAGLPPSLQQIGAAYIPITTTTADEERRVERVTQPVSVALGVLAGAAALATVVVVGMAVARELRRGDGENLQWWRVGASRRQRVLAAVVPVGLVVATGVVLALPLAWLLSPVAPVGIVRAVDPSPARELSPAALLVGLGLLLVLGVMTVLLGVRAAGRVAVPPVVRHGSVVSRLLRGSNRPAVDEGIRGAFSSNRGAGLVVATGGLAAALLLVALVFATSLSNVLSTPRAYGWPWDLAIMGGYGYGGVSPDEVEATLDDDPDVEGWTGLGLSNSVTLDGTSLVSVLGFDRTSSVSLPVVDGRLPAADGEVALGARTADEEGLGIGDEVQVAGYEVGEEQSARVVGIVVLPAIGPFQADRAAPGRGMLLPEAMVDRDVTDIPGGGTAITFVGIDLRDGVEPAAALDRLREKARAWDVNGYTPFTYPAPVRPAEIVDADAMRSVPTVVAVLLVGSATVALSAAVVLSIRSRRRDLAVLRSLGFTAGQVRGSVRVQSLVTMAVALLLGVPLGVAAGRIAWRGFADQLGVVTAPSTPGLWLVATVGGGVLIAVLAAAVPARLATASSPGRSLRGE